MKHLILIGLFLSHFMEASALAKSSCKNSAETKIVNHFISSADSNYSNNYKSDARNSALLACYEAKYGKCLIVYEGQTQYISGGHDIYSVVVSGSEYNEKKTQFFADADEFHHGNTYQSDALGSAMLKCFTAGYEFCNLVFEGDTSYGDNGAIHSALVEGK